MDEQQAGNAARQFVDALHRIEEGDANAVEAITALFTEDARLSNSILVRSGSELRGRQEIEHFWREYVSTFGQVHSDFHDITASDHSAGLFWHSSGSDASGKPVEYEGVTLLSFDDQGRIQRFKGYFDPRQATLSARH